MPKIVDHGARRDMVATATWQVIARNGLAHTTVREIAKEAGVSNGALAHYFRDKNDILVSALCMAHERVVERIRAEARGQRGLAALRVHVVEALPLDDERLLEAHVEVSCSGLAAADPVLARAQREDYERWWARLRDRVEEAQRQREVRASACPDDVAHAALVLIDGLSFAAVMHPALVTPARQRDRLHDFLTSIVTPSGARLLTALEAGELGHVALGA